MHYNSNITTKQTHIVIANTGYLTLWDFRSCERNMCMFETTWSPIGLKGFGMVQTHSVFKGHVENVHTYW